MESRRLQEAGMTYGRALLEDIEARWDIVSAAERSVMVDELQRLAGALPQNDLDGRDRVADLLRRIELIAEEASADPSRGASDRATTRGGDRSRRSAPPDVMTRV
jgi:hypothetical protein